MEKKHRNEYDDTKELLKRIRKLNNSSKQQIEEQITGSKPRLGDMNDDELNQLRPESQSQERLQADIKPQTEEEPSNWEAPQGEEDPSNWEKPGDNQPQPEAQENPIQPETGGDDNKDYDVVNNVEIVINSTDTADLQLNDDEKGKISQLIDDFRAEVSEIAEFGQLNIYDDNAKLDGNLGEVNLGFTLSAGDDNGLFLSNSAMVQINDNIMEFIDKLKIFQVKFNDTLNEIISNRLQN